MSTVLAKKPGILTDLPMHYCPGCGHGIVHRLVAETLEELNITDRAIGVAPVGCAVFADSYFACDFVQGAHGRGPAIATGVKRSKPQAIVFSYQGDGDLASIGMAEIVHAAVRSENITVIFINNAIYGMTGGQMAPTTLVGQVATTAPKGRDPKLQGWPINMCEMLSQITGSKFLARGAVDTPQNVLKTKQYIKKAFENQVNNVGFSMVEVISQCPTNWHADVQQALEFVRTKMIPQYPLGVFKDEEAK
ncbi:MAG: 2-oxoglutarate oxidoreductase [Elusimicrobiaceae bacterium]|nr:2-oxoglutarate oxidoreductase [Elusimicrobiaceae bacterium]